MNDATLAIAGPILMLVLFLALIAALLFGEQFGEWFREKLKREIESVNGPDKWVRRWTNCSSCQMALLTSSAISLHTSGKQPKYFCAGCRPKF